MKKIKITETFFQGCVSVERTKRGLKPWRLPIAQKPLFVSPEENCAGRAECGSGVRMRLRTNSPSLTLHVVPFEGGRLFDLVIDNEIVQEAILEGKKKSVTFAGLPGKQTVMEIWFAPNAPIEVTGIEVESGKTCTPAKDNRKRWISYGSSITQCSAAQSPANIWTGVAARALNLNLTSIGLGGQCHIDPMFARTIRDLPADFISLKLGINVQGHGSLNSRSYRPAIIGTVMTIREKHPKTTVMLISPVCSPPRESTPNHVGMTLEIMRAEMQDAFKRLKKVTGDENLYYLNGLRLANAAFAEKYMPDDLHPNGPGYIRMGKNFVKALPAPLKTRFTK
ncbi:MAG: SGNH/GDSL hydrolase family protein [Planctomycetota bacterium]|jgi:hypothetical protein